MKKPVCSLTSERSNRQSIFWAFVDQKAREPAANMAEKMLQLQLEAHLKAAWNQSLVWQSRGNYGMML